MAAWLNVSWFQYVPLCHFISPFVIVYHCVSMCIYPNISYMVAASEAPGERRVACRPAAIACGHPGTVSTATEGPAATRDWPGWVGGRFRSRGPAILGIWWCTGQIWINHAHLPEQLFQQRSSCRQNFYNSTCRKRLTLPNTLCYTFVTLLWSFPASTSVCLPVFQNLWPGAPGAGRGMPRFGANPSRTGAWHRALAIQ